MKRKFLLASVLLPSFLAAQQTTSLDNFVARRGEKMGNCTGNKGNICEFEKIDDPSQSITLEKQSNTTLLMRVDLTGLGDKEEVNWLGKSLSEVNSGEEIYFTQDFNFELHEEIISGLYLDQNSNCIAKGKYLITIKGNTHLEILFSLTSK
ncbi:hypothetical protein GV828_07660 [Flavobacterium sp. NST-5]|uniref:Uncharacterized protein n=1 Tax=Flavobacterium ichthyis TaxID=2698827 RepID=A0ABW9Z892_9FLAO|nr:hypothetical protein [Flavobacterium ichthyis]NBL65073.1 hypothetical protein [Flavobacterium ichthyis]